MLENLPKTRADKDQKLRSSKPWNKGKSVGQKKPFTPEQVKIIRGILREEGSNRDLALFCVAIDTMLRASDLLKLKVGDVMEKNGDMKTEFEVMQQKTSKGTSVTLTPICQDALVKWITQDGKLQWDYLFTGTRKSKHKPITENGYRRLVKKWAIMARLDPSDYSSHSLRRTKASLVFQATNNAEVVRQLLGHSSIASTSAYLGVDKREALEIARRIDI